MFEKVKKIVVDTLNCEMEDVTMEARLAEDLEADSLDAVELNMALEDELGGTGQHEDRGRHRELSGGPRLIGQRRKEGFA